MKTHLRRWGAAYLLLVLFLASWVGQAIAQIVVVGDTRAEFWAATFENWQSEWLQLLVQAIALLALKHVLFKADAEDQERLEGKVDAIMRAHGIED